MDVDGSLQLLNSGSGVSLLKGQRVPCRFCGSDDGDGHLFRECPFPPLVEIRENPEFHDLVELDKSSWPRCLLWHGWLLLLSGVNGSPPWAGSPRERACNLLECALGRYSSDAATEWQLPVGFDAEGQGRKLGHLTEQTTKLRCTTMTMTMTLREVHPTTASGLALKA